MGMWMSVAGRREIGVAGEWGGGEQRGRNGWGSSVEDKRPLCTAFFGKRALERLPTKRDLYYPPPNTHTLMCKDTRAHTHTHTHTGCGQQFHTHLPQIM